MIDFGPVERMLRPLRAADGAEREGSRGWIEGVKRRLGLVTLEDDAAARLRQWEHDHLPIAPEPALYECDCCERPNVPAKSKGIGYLCEDCLTSWTWPYGRYPGEEEPPDHHAGRTCPFKIPA